MVFLLSRASGSVESISRDVGSGMLVSEVLSRLRNVSRSFMSTVLSWFASPRMLFVPKLFFMFSKSN